MRRLVVIAVSGLPGSGKTTYAKFIAKEYGLRYISNGMLFRQLAKERGVSFEEFHRIAEQDPSIDLEIDRRAMEEAKKGGVVIDGHLPVWVLGDLAHLKIVFVAPLEERARRVASRDGLSYEDALEKIKWREESNWRRANKYYGVDIRDLSVADLIVNTGKLDIKGVKSVVKAFIDEFRRLNPELFP